MRLAVHGKKIISQTEVVQSDNSPKPYKPYLITNVIKHGLKNVHMATKKTTTFADVSYFTLSISDVQTL